MASSPALVTPPTSGQADDAAAAMMAAMMAAECANLDPLLALRGGTAGSVVKEEAAKICKPATTTAGGGNRSAYNGYGSRHQPNKYLSSGGYAASLPKRPVRLPSKHAPKQSFKQTTNQSFKQPANQSFGQAGKQAVNQQQKRIGRFPDRPKSYGTPPALPKLDRSTIPEHWRADRPEYVPDIAEGAQNTTFQATRAAASNGPNMMHRRQNASNQTMAQSKNDVKPSGAANNTTHANTPEPLAAIESVVKSRYAPEEDSNAELPTAFRKALEQLEISFRRSSFAKDKDSIITSFMDGGSGAIVYFPKSYKQNVIDWALQPGQGDLIGAEFMAFNNGSLKLDTPQPSDFYGPLHDKCTDKFVGADGVAIRCLC